jgi:hypothetical protein
MAMPESSRNRRNYVQCGKKLYYYYILPGETLSTDSRWKTVYFVASEKLFEKASLEVKFLLQPYQVFDCDILYLDYVEKIQPLNFICATICDFGNDRHKISEKVTGQ